MVDEFGWEVKLAKEAHFHLHYHLFLLAQKNKDTPIHLNELMETVKEQMIFSKLEWMENAAILVVDDQWFHKIIITPGIKSDTSYIEEAKDGKMALKYS